MTWSTICFDCIFSDDGIATIKASHNTADKNIDVSFGVERCKDPTS